MKRAYLITLLALFAVAALQTGCATNNSGAFVNLTGATPVSVSQKNNTSTTQKSTTVQANSNNVNVTK